MDFPDHDIKKSVIPLAKSGNSISTTVGTKFNGASLPHSGEIRDRMVVGSVHGSIRVLLLAISASTPRPDREGRRIGRNPSGSGNVFVNQTPEITDSDGVQLPDFQTSLASHWILRFGIDFLRTRQRTMRLCLP